MNSGIVGLIFAPLEEGGRGEPEAGEEMLAVEFVAELGNADWVRASDT